MGRFEGKVVLVTGAARGQGRVHARRFAAEGADVVALDVCAPVVPGLGYPPARPDDLAETVRQVEQVGGACVAKVADVREQAGIDEAVAEGLDRFGRLDVVVANAAVVSYHRTWEVPEDQWHAVVDSNLTGVWRTIRATVPPMIDAGQGGAIAFTSSAAGLKGFALLGHYAATKHALVGLMRSLAIELGPYDIRVNTVHPGVVDTPMGRDPSVQEAIAAHPELTAAYQGTNPIAGGQSPDDIADAVLWLCSQEARRITGATLPVDGGTVVR
jgi:SDR family mycofactocin-dependent oxidoreductase